MSSSTTTLTSSITPQTLHHALLRPPVLDILRAAGFTRTRPAVLDTVIDLTYRYLSLLATSTARHALARSTGTRNGNGNANANPSGETEISITDIRKALLDVGALYPQLSEMEEAARGEEDMRGVEAFVEWCVGDVNAEIRRVAGMSNVTSTSAVAAGTAGVSMVGTSVVPGTNGTGGVGGAGGGRRMSATAAAAAAAASAAAATNSAAAEAEALLAAEGREDYLTQLKKKHSKTGEESRWQGSVLGKEGGEREVVIEGWEVGDLKGWGKRLEMQQMALLEERGEEEGVLEEGRGEGVSGSSSPLSEMTGSGLDSGFG